jgi:hypothetical protein
MGGFLQRLLGGGEPAGPPQTVRRFGPAEQPLTRDGVSLDGDAWRIESGGERTVALFEVPDPGVEACMLAYRASLKSEDAAGVYLEMWCRLPGRGEFFSKGTHQVLKGTTDWVSGEIPFRLKKGQRPDLIKLNLAFQGAGTAWIKDVELLQTPFG